MYYWNSDLSYSDVLLEIEFLHWEHRLLLDNSIIPYYIIYQHYTHAAMTTTHLNHVLSDTILLFPQNFPPVI